VTCTLLLLPDRVETAVLQPPHLELEELEINDRTSAVVVGLGLVRRLSRDPEDRDAAAVRPADADAHELGTAQQSEPAQEEVVRLQHSPPPAGGGRPSSLPERRPPPAHASRLSTG